MIRGHYNVRLINLDLKLDREEELVMLAGREFHKEMVLAFILQSFF